MSARRSRPPTEKRRAAFRQPGGDELAARLRDKESEAAALERQELERRLGRSPAGQDFLRRIRSL